MAKVPDKFSETIYLIAKELNNKAYAIRGTASLVLQGLDMNVDDIDVLADKETALFCNIVFEKYMVKKVVYSESKTFKSYFGEFSINDIKVEIMGEWKINDKLFDVLDRKKVKVLGQDIYVTTISSELKCFAEMKRWNAYWKIKKQMKKLNMAHLSF